MTISKTLLIFILPISFYSIAQEEKGETVVREMIKNQKKNQKTMGQRFDIGHKYSWFLVNLTKDQRKNAYKYLKQISVEQRGAQNMLGNSIQLYLYNMNKINERYQRNHARTIENLNELIAFWNKNKRFDPIFWIKKCKEAGALVQPTKFNKKVKKWEYYDCTSFEWLKINKDWIYLYK